MTNELPVPEGELNAYRCIMANWLNLSQFHQDFQHSVALFELLERGGGPPSVGVFGGIFVYYRIIAARNGALSLYHFRCSLEAIKKQLPTCPTFYKKVDAVAIREALKKFDTYFQHIESVRHGVAHAGEVYKNQNAMHKNENKTGHVGVGFSISGGGGHFDQALFERTYSVGNKGSIFSVRLDNNAISNLAHIILLVANALPGSS